jgi:hypothetical protein
MASRRNGDKSTHHPRITVTSMTGIWSALMMLASANAAIVS